MVSKYNHFGSDFVLDGVVFSGLPSSVSDVFAGCISSKHTFDFSLWLWSAAISFLSFYLMFQLLTAWLGNPICPQMYSQGSLCQSFFWQDFDHCCGHNYWILPERVFSDDSCSTFTSNLISRRICSVHYTIHCSLIKVWITQKALWLNAVIRQKQATRLEIHLWLSILNLTKHISIR